MATNQPSSSSNSNGRRSRTRVEINNVLDALNCDDSDVEGYDDDSDEDWEDTPAATQPDSDSSDDDVPLADLFPPPAQPNSGKRVYRWRKKAFTPKSTTFLGKELSPPADMAVKSPYQYFREFITDDMIVRVVENTNLYSTQKSGKSINTTNKEVEQMLGMFFRMGLVKMPGIRQYWESATAYPPVSGVMSRNRFKALVANLHFVDNLLVTDEEKKKDKLWKIRPWIDSIRAQCLRLTPEELQSIDEMMCQYTGKTSPCRQYIKSKPHPWGFKIWGRAGVTGLLHDFEVYQGGDGTRTELGQGADVVLRLTSTLEEHGRYKIFADNLFTSLPLISKMNERGMFYTGTVRANRLPGCSLKEEKALKKEGRGSYDSYVEEVNNVVAVRWYDNKAVSLLSSLVGVLPLGEAKRWDKTTKEHRNFPMPAIVQSYNKSMGGIDLLDSFLAKYRFPMKSKRWYLYLFWHFVMVAVVNAWNLYRRDSRLLNLPAKEILNRRKFQAEVAESLISVRAGTKRGRPSGAGDASATPPPPRKIRKGPCDDVRFDGYAHWPIKLQKRGRCKLCERTTNTACEKCDICLCFLEERNCFRSYHLK